jgi:hypothetical protein
VRVGTDNPAEYWFDHPAAVLLIGPDTRVTAAFAPPLVSASIAGQVRTIIEYADPAT